jgi:2-polyprenyl-3-methyl-5-hydroxy-6-metoxy-1,4-benzoquinol methylase
VAVGGARRHEDVDRLQERLDRERIEEVGDVGEGAELSRQWQQMLEGWAVPGDLIAQARESPYFFDPAVFIEAADVAISRAEDTPSDRAARDALAEGGTVLDVGVGAGAASLRLRPAHITGVDPSATLLEAFAARATKLGIAHAEAVGKWPDAAPRVVAADVVVCHHVVYNVTDLASFVSALAAHAHRRVVVELTAMHPMSWLAPYWMALHGLTQPQTPTSDNAAAVVSALGFDAHQQRSRREVQMIGERGDEQEARIARRLCLGSEHMPELRRLLAATPPPATREIVTLWWDVPST